MKLKRVHDFLLAVFLIIPLVSCAENKALSEERFIESFQALSPETKLSLETENVSQNKSGIAHVFFAERGKNTYLLEVLTDEVNGDVKACSLLCPGKSGEIIKNYLDMRFCILKSFTEKPENECKEILKELPLIENSGTVNIIKKDKFILREYPAADGYMFVIENSEIFEKEETTAFAVSPKFEPKIMETLTIPKAR